MKSSNRICAGVALALVMAMGSAAAHAAPASARQAQEPMPSPACHYRHWTKGQLAALDKALAAQGFKSGAGACWNHALRAAVTAFQKKAGIEPTGFPNRKTRKALGLDW